MGRWCQQSLSTPHLHVLMTLEASGPMTMSRLAELRDMSLSNATGIVTRMEERGLVERIHDEHDRRLVQVRLTAAGEAVITELEFVRRSHLIRILEAMGPAGRQQFAQACRTFFETRRRLVEAGAFEAPDATADTLSLPSPERAPGTPSTLPLVPLRSQGVHRP